MKDEYSIETTQASLLLEIPHRPYKLSAITVERSSKVSGARKLPILLWVSFHTAAYTLLIRHSRTRVVEKMYIRTVAVFVTEVIKLVICLVMLFIQEVKPQRFVSALSHIIHQPTETLKLGIPTVLYIIHNNLHYIAASHLDAARFMIGLQLKIFTTAVFAVLMLDRILTRWQWFSLLLLFFGVCMVQFQPQVESYSPFGPQRPMIAAASLISGYSGIYLERIFKGSAPVSVWTRNIQMAAFAVPSSLLSAYAEDGPFLASEGLFHGFDSFVWLLVFWNGIGGLSAAICIKYADNISKNFAHASAIILAAIGSVLLFDFTPSVAFVLGTALVIVSMFLFSSRITCSIERRT